MFSPTEPESEKPKNDNLEDIFSSSTNSAPANPPPPQNSGSVDDLFSAPASSGGQYVPPVTSPQQRGGNRVLYIILGIVIAFMCICLACIGLAGGSIFAVFKDPTFQAGIATVQGVYGTGVALASLPTALPSDAVQKGALHDNSLQSSTLGAVSRDVWTYGGKKGENVTIVTQSQNPNLGLLFAIYDTNNKLLSQTSLFNSADKSQSLTVTLPDDGTYNILVGTIAGTGGANGSYTVIVQSTPR